jgi:hypothetical protein
VRASSSTEISGPLLPPSEGAQSLEKTRDPTVVASASAVAQVVTVPDTVPRARPEYGDSPRECAELSRPREVTNDATVWMGFSEGLDEGVAAAPSSSPTAFCAPDADEASLGVPTPESVADTFQLGVQHQDHQEFEAPRTEHQVHGGRFRTATEAAGRRQVYSALSLRTTPSVPLGKPLLLPRT